MRCKHKKISTEQKKLFNRKLHNQKLVTKISNLVGALQVLDLSTKRSLCNKESVQQKNCTTNVLNLMGTLQIGDVSTKKVTVQRQSVQQKSEFLLYTFE